MKKMLIAFAILLSTGLGSMQVARADTCMDSAEEAVAAFWTGGASYLICKTVETVQSMVRVVQTLANSMARMTNETIDTARQLVQETANSVDQNTRNAMNRLNGMVNDARRLAATPPPAAPALQATRAATAPAAAALSQHGTQAPGTAAFRQHGTQAPVATVAERMADPNQLRDALRQGADTMARIHSTLQSQVVNHIYSAAQLARNQAERHLNSARRIGETSLMAPIRQLEQMLNDILRHPERLFDPTSLVNESIERLTVAMTQVAEQIHHEISSEALATVRGVDQHVRRVTGDTETAARLHEAMTKAHQARTQQSLDKLRAALQTANGGSASGSAVLLQSGVMFQVVPHIQQTHKASLDKARQPYQQHINTLKLQGSNIKDMRAMKQANRLPPGTEQRAKAELDRMLKGKSPAEAENIKRDLKARLLTQYRNVPVVHAELNRNFDSRFAAHLRANPALLRPVAPAVGQPGLLLPAVQR